jgi:two-component system nitrate/nitrite response regulator NarL
MNKQIRVLIVDDHTLFRESLSRLLEADTECKIVGACASIEDALKIVAREQIDLVLLDYDLGEKPGTRFLDESRRCGFTGPVLMVTGGMVSPPPSRLLFTNPQSARSCRMSS